MAQLLLACRLPLWLGVASLSLSGCQSFDPEGEYQGNYFHMKQEVSRVDPVQIEVRSIPLHRYHVVVKDLKNHKISEFSLFVNHLQ